MADNQYEIDIIANDNVSAIFAKIGRNLQSLNNNFSDLADAIKDLSKATKTSTESTAQSIEKMSKEADIASEKMAQNLMRRANYAKKAADEIAKSMGGNAKAIKAMSGLGEPLTGSQRSLAYFDGLRNDAARTITTMQRLKQEINAAYKAARDGDQGAAGSVSGLTQRYKELNKELQSYKDQLKSANQEFKNIAGPKNTMLSAMGYRPITVNDIFPTAEQQKLADVKKRISDATFLSINQGAIRDTVNQFFNTGLGLQNIDENVIKVASNLPRLRYALYDVSNSLALFSAGLLAIPIAVSAIAIAFDRDFANVKRTTGLVRDEANAVKRQFVELSKTIPVSFKDLTNIGELAGQLNIGKDSLVKFTETVAKFAATTDVTTTEAATAFGRLDQLIKGVNGQYDRLGSSILTVGVNSVATESQIIRIASQISSIANLAGFSADQIIGLSGALASVGTTPELSRGLFTRLFTEINGAISGANSNLSRFAALAGQTADEFKKGWQEGGAAWELVAMLRGLGEQGPRAEQTLRSLNIASVRDIPTVLKLAQGYQQLAYLLNLAQKGWIDNTELQIQYNVITSTVAEKINILVNNVKALFSTLGQAQGILGIVVDGLIALVSGLENIANNPVAGTIAGITFAFVALIGVMGLFGSLLTRISGGFGGLLDVSIKTRTMVAAMRTAFAESALAVRENQAATISAAGSTSILSRATTGLRATMAGGIAANKAFAASLFEIAKESNVARIAWQTFAKSTLILAAIMAIGEAWNLVADATKSATDKAKEYYGDTSSILQAALKDTEDLSNGIQSQSDIWKTVDISTTSESIKNVGLEAANAVSPTNDLIDGQTELRKSLGLTNDALNQQQIAFGNAARGAIQKIVTDKILSDQENPIYKIFKDENYKKVLDAAKFDLNQFTQDVINNNTQAVDAQLAKLNELKSKTFIWSDVGGLNTNLSEGLNFYLYTLQQVQAYIYQYKDSLSGLADTAVTSTNIQLALNEALGVTTDETQDGASAFDTWKSKFNDAFGDLDLIKQANDDVETLINGLEQNGVAFNNLSAGGVSNLINLRAALYSVAASAEAQGGSAVNAIAAVFARLRDQGVNTAILLQQVAALGINVAQVQAAMNKISPAPMQKLASAAGGASKQVKTLVDYANDLSGVFSRAFDIRFGGQTSLDDITKGWRDMADATEEARQSVQDLNNDIDQLTADKSMTEYFLSVAEAYGDTIRAAELRAKLGKIDSDLAKKNKDLAKAQNATNKTLVGNSDAAIENRANILDMIKAYQEHIKTLAASGMNQAELAAATAQLKQDFYAQATALGYSRNELDQYGATFDDVGKIINNVPRNITVNFNADPAIQALNEFIDKAASAGSAFSDAFNENAVLEDPLDKKYFTDYYVSGKGYQYGGSFTSGASSSIKNNSGKIDTALDTWMNIFTLGAWDAAKAFGAVGPNTANEIITARPTVNTALSTWRSIFTFGAWDAAKAFGAVGSASASEIVNAKPKINGAFSTWSASGAQGAQNIQSSFNSMSDNIPNSISSKNNSIWWAFRGLGGHAKGGWNSVFGNIGSAIGRFFGWYATGGYTGAGGKYEPAGIVHKGEYVIPKEQVNQSTGLPYYMQQTRSFANGGFASQSASAMMVYLSPEDRALLRGVGGSGEVILYANNEAIARSANAGNRSIVAAGGRP